MQRSTIIQESKAVYTTIFEISSMKVVLNFELQSWKGYKDNTIIKKIIITLQEKNLRLMASSRKLWKRELAHEVLSKIQFKIQIN